MLFSNAILDTDPGATIEAASHTAKDSLEERRDGLNVILGEFSHLVHF